MSFFDFLKSGPQQESIKAVLAPHCVAIGEFLWDIYEVEDHSKPPVQHPGGAPFNFAYHAHQLGAKSELITSIGRDHPGELLLRHADKMGVSTRGVQKCPYFHTGTASVSQDRDGGMRFVIHPGVAWDDIEMNPIALSMVESAEIIYFGTLAQRAQKSRHTILELLSKGNKQALKVFDVNIREQFYSSSILADSLKHANVVKMSDEDLPRVAYSLSLPLDHAKMAKALFERYPVELFAVTLGRDGSRLFTKDGGDSNIGAAEVSVVDTVGAGDAFTAALALGWRRRMDLSTLHVLASEVAGYVCTRSGATPVLLPMYRKRMGY